MFATSLLVHIVGFGLPVALLDRWWAGVSARRAGDLPRSATAIS
jgi:outer membrane biogenesis lipoprotein LolB